MFSFFKINKKQIMLCRAKLSSQELSARELSGKVMYVSKRIYLCGWVTSLVKMLNKYAILPIILSRSLGTSGSFHIHLYTETYPYMSSENLYKKNTGISSLLHSSARVYGLLLYTVHQIVRWVRRPHVFEISQSGEQTKHLHCLVWRVAGAPSYCNHQ